MPAAAVREAVEEGLFEGLACFVDHAPDGPAGRRDGVGPSLRRLVGTWRGVDWRLVGEGSVAAVGILSAYETDATRPVLDLLDQWLEDESEAGAAAADMGVSIVFYPLLEEDGRTVRRIVMVESADLVMFPASEGSRVVGRVGD
jgi:hypothetical protein